MLRPQKLISPDHEALFIERYDRLLAWGLQLTERDQEAAEDVLHDAFIQFTLTPPDLQSIHNLDAYLYGMLRNLHLSQMRRATRSRFQQLSVVDYESAQIGLQAADPRAHIQVQEELRRVCHYACARKQASRAGSVLILRFFHGYYPSEIATVLQCSRVAVDLQIKRARTEARAFLEHPEGLSFIQQEIPHVLPAGFARTPDRFTNELRELVFSSRQGGCLRNEELKRLYRSKTALTFESSQLAHLVSCPSCLDSVNRLLDLPLLKDRYAVDTLGNDPRSKGGPGGGSPAGGGLLGRTLKRWKRDAGETFEHKPQELCIAVNGYLQASQRISSMVNEQSLTIDTDERIGFVEVFSEQGIRLLLLNVDEAPPEGPGERHLRVQFSDTRALELSLKFSSPWPTLRVVYTDPTLGQIPSLESEVVQQVQSPMSNVQSLSGETGSDLNAALLAPRRKLLALVRGGWSTLKRRADIGHWTWDIGLLFRPGLVTALLAVMLVVSLMFLYRRAPAPPLSASDLLQKASTAEEAILARADQVVHRTINLEEKSASGALIAQRKIEVWQSAEQGITARRLYDERGQLVAGDWRRSDGVQTLYHHAKRPQVQTLSPQTALRDFESVWQFDLAANEFSKIVGQADQMRVEERPNAYVITYEARNHSSSQLNPAIDSAVIILDQADLHPIEQTLVIRLGSETREYRFLEAGFERRLTDEVTPEVFEPDPQLLSFSALGRGTDPESSTTSASAPGLVAPVATLGIEVEVLNLLNRVGADITEQLNVTRTADGRLLVEGLVETDKRKQEILKALSPVASNPAIRIKVQTLEEATRALQRQSAQANQMVPGTVERVEVEKGKLAVDAELRAYFERNSSNGGDVDEKIRAFVSRVINRSKGAAFQASALNRMANRFNAEQLKALDPAARAKYLGMLKGYAATVRRETAAFRGELQAVFGDVSDAGGESVANDADLIASARRLFELASQNDRVIRSAFTISGGGTSVSAIKSAQFRRSLGQAEALAAAIERAR